MFKVVEKHFDAQRRTFVYTSGLWFDRLVDARASAASIAATTLAHRLFIMASANKPLEKQRVAEEIELPPLAQRMAAVHSACLLVRDPERLQAELARVESTIAPTTAQLPLHWARRPGYQRRLGPKH